MKALILKDDNGQQYDDFQEWTANVFLVPDDFDLEVDEDLFYTVGIKAPKYAGQVQFRKNGELKLGCYKTAYKLYIASLKERFEEIGFIE